jgi:HPt (histidine-containing phosphotransfer) domain-containing protein
MSPDELIDRAVVREIAEVGDDATGTLRLLEGFAADARRTLSAMRDWALRGETAPLMHAAHRLKGSSGSVGAIGLAAECLALERCAREGRTAGLAGRIETALGVLEQTRAAFSYALGDSNMQGTA